MMLSEWLETNGMSQGTFAEKVGLTQGRISQIIAKGTRDIMTARRIEDATDGAVPIAALLPDDWREALGRGEPAPC